MTTITEPAETAPASTEPKPTQQPRSAKTRANVASKVVRATFTIDSENNVIAHAGLPPAGANEPFANLKDLTRLAAKWPLSRLVDIWNSFAGAAPFNDLKPVKKFTSRDIALARVWEAVERLAPMVAAAPAVAPPARGLEATRPKATKYAAKGKRGDTARQGAKSGQRSAPATRDGSKASKILELLKRPGGATSKDLQKASGWQPHSVRGFLSGTVGKKLGLTVVSTKEEDGARSYSVKA